jgi:hypothetical protein
MRYSRAGRKATAFYQKSEAIQVDAEYNSNHQISVVFSSPIEKHRKSSPKETLQVEGIIFSK